MTQPPFNGPLSGTTQLGQYQKKHSPTHTHPDHQTSFINFIHLLLLVQFTCLVVLLHNLSPGPLGLEPSASYSIHFFTQLLLPLASCAHTIATCFAEVLKVCHLFLSLNSSLGNLPFTLTSHIHLTILIFAC